MGIADGMHTKAALSAATAIGAVRLVVRDLDRSRQFYEQMIGLQARERDDGTLALHSGDNRTLIELIGDPAASALNRRATGLYHLALLLPTRQDLAMALARLAAARWPLDGASDHLVSEALYLSDPDGNGIEIYRDRPREQWPREDEQIQMATLPLDLDVLLGELAGVEQLTAQAPPGSVIGHVHLQVSELQRTEAFYHGILGFEVMVRLYPGALFVAAGGYHHHIGLNTWHSAGGSPPPSRSVGLRHFEVVLEDQGQLDAVLQRADAAGVAVAHQDHGVLLRDPSQNGVLLRVRD